MSYKTIRGQKFFPFDKTFAFCTFLTDNLNKDY